jgi:large subunit ribosomal protein L30
MEKTIKITQTRSLIRTKPAQRATMRSLGLGRIGRSVEHTANGAILGMVAKVSHLVSVEDAAN